MIVGLDHFPLATGAALLLALSLSGCAPEHWENPNIPEADWTGDVQDCRQVAEGTAEHEYNLEQDASAEPSLDYYAPEEAYEQQMDTFSAEGLDQQTFRTCMLQKGYYLVPDKDVAK